MTASLHQATTPPLPAAGPLLADVVDEERLAEMVAAKYVRRQTHPSEPLAILNYTDGAMYDRVWNDVTRTCRGLIYRTDTGEVVARPWVKFHNHGEPGAPYFDLTARTVVTDKMDGSLAICYPLPSGGYAIATRGSFESEQALHGTDLLRVVYGDWEPPAGVTVLFEVIFARNRIVLDYGDLDALVFLGAVDIATGQSLPQVAPLYGWTGPAVPMFGYATLAEALAAAPRPNAEGLVVHFVDADLRCKIKQDDYKALHAILTRTSARVLWRYLAVNACQHLIAKPVHWGSYLEIDPRDAAQIMAVGPDWLPSFVERVPDEFYGWLQATISGIQQNVADLDGELRRHARHLIETHDEDRKAFAAAVKDHPHSGALFMLLDEKNIDLYLWLYAYPEADRPFMTISEDAA